MKIIVGITLLLSLSPAVQAKDKFAGIYFDSSIPSTQARTIEEDLTYLYLRPIKNVDPQFQSMTKMSSVDGPHMFNWIYNRVKYIIGEDYKTWGRNLVKKSGYEFPSTPLPPSIVNRTNSYGAVLIMSNVGAELYLTGKRDKVLKGIKLDRKNVFAPSPRVGILKIGEGLFLERFLINKNINSEANKIKRIGTLFHEARHGDGHSEHIGFIHNRCPDGHNLSGFAACESSSNGPYSIEAVAMKTLLLNCHNCTEIDKTKLSTVVADSFSRVIVHSHVKTEPQLLKEIETYQRVVDFYLGYLSQNPKDESSKKELARLMAKISECEEQLKELKTPVQPQELDSRPEGSFEEVTVDKSSNLMRTSLAR